MLYGFTDAVVAAILYIIDYIFNEFQDLTQQSLSHLIQNFLKSLFAFIEYYWQTEYK